MKTPENNDQLHRWLDGELNPAERTAFEAAMRNDPALKREAEAMKRIGEAMRAHVPMDMPVPNADFFNSQITERISQMQQSDERAKASAGGRFRLLDLFRSPWAMIAATAVVVVGFFAMQPHDSDRTQVVSLYAPDPAVRAQINYNAAAGATVMMLDGLAPMPAERPVAGFNVHHSESDTAMATTTLYDERGDVLLVMAKDARNQPLLLLR